MNIKINSLILTLALACAALLPAALSAGAPLKINFQGRLDEGGQPAAGSKTFVFEIYDAASGGSPLWTSAPQALDLANGVFSAVLSAGSPAALSTATFAGARFVAMTVDGVPLSPRQEMVSAPYAMVAQALAPDAVLPPAQLLAASVTDYHVLLTTAAIGAGKFGDARVSLSTAAVASGRFGDDRVLITTGAFTGGFNAANKLVQLDGTGKLPASALTETDPLFTVSASSLIVSGDITNWDAAYGWGNHATAGYATQTDVSTALADYETTAAHDADLAGYETTAAHNASLTAYAALTATQTFSGVNSFNSGVSMPIRSVSADTALTDSDHTLLANSAGGSISVTLPSAAGRAGRIYVVKKTSMVNSVLVLPQPGQTIDQFNYDMSQLVLGSVDGWDSVMVQSDGANWFILSAYQPPPGI